MQVSEQNIEILDNGLCDGNHFTLQGQLDRKDYTSINKVLIAAGGKWNRGAKAHVFGCLAEDAISDIILTGKVVDAKREFDFFETPDELADQIIDFADISSNHLVLEPSAGHGQIAKRAAAISSKVDVIEIQRSACDTLADALIYRNVFNHDFLLMDIEVEYDRIVMNPPFGKQADIKHVVKATTLLKPGGRLVAIMSAGVEFRQNKLTTKFRAAVESYGGEFHQLPSGSFKASGTAVNTVILTLTKPT